MRMLAAAVALLLASRVVAEDTPYSVARLVTQPDDAALVEPLTAALQSPAPLVRATAARVIAVRGLTGLLPSLRERMAAESDATASREQIRALALLGGAEDIAMAAQTASRWPAGMDNALAIAVARRGAPAVDSYLSTLRTTRMSNFTEFFRVALWGRADLIPLTGSRLLAKADENGWRGVLGALEESNAAMHAGMMTASLTSSSEDIRTSSVWFLIRSYAFDPTAIPDLLKARLAEKRAELSSDREDFGLELLQRMLGGEKKDDPRWLKFLETGEADRLFKNEEKVLQYLTDDEYRIRYKRCEIQIRECAMPAKRSYRQIPSQPVAPPAFNLPELLPAGLSDAILAGTKCRDSWIGVADVSVDPAGRVRALELRDVSTVRSCKEAIDVLLRLSMATNTSLRSLYTGPVLLVRPARASLCLDEDVPQENTNSTLLRVGGAVEAPVVKKRVEPAFPASARAAMGSGRNVIVMLECVISKDGCVRSVRILTQSPYPEINGAAVFAISQWKFTPGRLDGKPVDVIFNLTVNFKVS